MEFSKSITDNTLTLHLNGDLDAQGCDVLRDEFVMLAEKPSFSMIDIDLENVQFIDSSGIGLIVFLFKKLRTQTIDLSIKNIHSQPLELIQLLRIESVITITPLISSDI